MTLDPIVHVNSTTETPSYMGKMYRASLRRVSVLFRYVWVRVVRDVVERMVVWAVVDERARYRGVLSMVTTHPDGTYRLVVYMLNICDGWWLCTNCGERQFRSRWLYMFVAGVVYVSVANYQPSGKPAS